MQHHRHRMGEVEGGIGGASADLQQPAGLKQFPVGQPPVLPAKHQGARRPRRLVHRIGLG